MTSTPAARERVFDLVLVGGGLQNALIALATCAASHKPRVALVEQAARPGGNHTWSLHAGSIPEAARAFVEPLIVQRWPGHEVRFPGYTRALQGAYATVSSERVAAHVLAALAQRPGSRVLLGRRAQQVGGHEVVLDDGSVLRGSLVVDARGPEVAAFGGHAGYQKFLGLELELQQPHRLAQPVVMDARVPQHEGFRFFYLLPLGPRRVLVEDTRFSLSPELDRATLVREVLAYASRLGRIAEIVREELGVLPMPWRGELSAPSASPLLGGYRGGWFHPATGYSFPAALRLACHVAARVGGRSSMRS